MSKWGPGYEISFSFSVSNFDTASQYFDNLFHVTSAKYGDDLRHPGMWISSAGYVNVHATISGDKDAHPGGFQVDAVNTWVKVTISNYKDNDDKVKFSY